MNKQEFLAILQKKLSKHLSKAEANERLSFYEEMINDQIEEGLSEADAVSKIGSADDIVNQILSEMPTNKAKKESSKQKRSKTEIIILAISSPLWVSLIIATVAVIFALFVSMWAVVISLFASVFAFAVSSIGGLIYSLVLLATSGGYSALFILSSAFVLAGLAIFGYYGCKALARGAIALTKKMLCLISKDKGVNENE